MKNKPRQDKRIEYLLMTEPCLFLIDQNTSCHLSRNWDSHQCKNCWGEVTEFSIGNFSFVRIVHQNTRNKIRSVCRVRGAIIVDHELCISMIGNDDGGVVIL